MPWCMVKSNFVMCIQEVACVRDKISIFIRIIEWGNFFLFKNIAYVLYVGRWHLFMLCRGVWKCVCHYMLYTVWPRFWLLAASSPENSSQPVIYCSQSALHANILYWIVIHWNRVSVSFVSESWQTAPDDDDIIAKLTTGMFNGSMALIKEMLQKFLRKYEEWQATRREFITEANVQWRTFLRHGAHSFEEFGEGEPNRLSHFWCWRCPAYPIKHPVVHLVVLLTKHSSRRCSTKFPTRIHTNEQTSKRASLTCANDGRPPNKKENRKYTMK